LENSFNTTFPIYKVLANSSNSPYLKIPDQSTNHMVDSAEPASRALAGRPVDVLAYRQVIYLGISNGFFPFQYVVFISFPFVVFYPS
jgi:hypothetical protein